MFRINRKVDYSIRVIVFLAKYPLGKRLATKKVQEEMLIPRPFLQRIIANLSKAALIRTYPGPNGGIELARQPSDINLKQIWEAIEGPLLISECIQSQGICPLDMTCPVRNRWINLQDMIVEELEAITLDVLASEVNYLDASVSGSGTVM
jgi:Rrf2 family transcriptional regulator, iron-sulfur cluster assembly transcription factor